MAKIAGVQLKNIAATLLFGGLSLPEKFRAQDAPLKYSPVFIVCPPRSGSTVLRQLISSGIQTSFFSNFLQASLRHLGYPLPWVAATLSKKLGVAEEGHAFKNQYGKITGFFSPAEGELIWGYCFGPDLTPIEPEELTVAQVRTIHKLVSNTEQVFNRPFVNKTTLLGLQGVLMRKI